MNYVYLIESWRILFHIAGNINYEQWLINRGLDEDKNKRLNKEKKIRKIFSIESKRDFFI